MGKQKTLKSSFSIKGVGLHTGKAVTVTAEPAPPGSGIVFKYVDDAETHEVRATVDNIIIGGRQTALRCGAKQIQTIEHLMASLNAFGITNAIIKIDNSELPALDGSALSYAREIEDVGTQEQAAEQNVVEVTEPVYLETETTSTVVLPHPELRISYTLSYNHPALSDQFVTYTVDEKTFVNELAPARTFCLKEEADALLAQGYGKGANYQNTLVFDDNVPVDNTLRFPDEAARHKVVDLIGDLYLLGCPLKGHIITCRTGHVQNVELVKRLSALKKKATRADNKEGVLDMINKRQFDINDIQKILPHRYPFLLIDRVISLEPGKRIIAIKNVTINEPFFQGHFEGHPIMPGVLIIEAMAQAGGILTMLKEENQGDKVAYFMSIDKAKFRSPVVPGDQLRFDITMIRAKGRIGICACKAYVEEKLVCEAEVKFTVMDR
ncbi:MAG: UDP-3-O-acyl-N-acetylglucosamine deacetylase [Candidatus Omnitrophica bacterium]|nr:UDP-3-O-acyl-N-acetylglucosamine deacetylase [Candidatus Omnitrophota bacterium]